MRLSLTRRRFCCRCGPYGCVYLPPSYIEVKLGIYSVHTNADTEILAISLFLPQKNSQGPTSPRILKGFFDSVNSSKKDVLTALEQHVVLVKGHSCLLIG